MIETEELKKYVGLQADYAELKEQLAERKRAFDEENMGLITEIDSLKEQLEEQKAGLTEAARVEYLSTGEKKLLGGLGIRVMTSLIYDEEEALRWAKEHQLCLILDKHGFESVAKSQQIDFVNYEDKIMVTFPREIKLSRDNHAV